MDLLSSVTVTHLNGRSEYNSDRIYVDVLLFYS